MRQKIIIKKKTTIRDKEKYYEGFAWVQGFMPVVTAIQEAKAEGSLEPRSLRLQ